jgi:CHAD domain-containing protein
LGKISKSKLSATEFSLNGVPDQKELLITAADRLRKTVACLETAVNSFGLDDIHDFRVEIKKLKGFLRLLQRDLDKPEKLKFPKFLNKIYKSLGSVRELQLQEKKLEKAISSETILLLNTFSNLHEQTESVREKAKELLDYKDSWNKAENRIKKFIPEELTADSVESYLRFKVRQLKKILYMKRISITRLHGMRKILKDLQYNHPYWKDARLAEGASLPSVDEIHDTGSLIGDLHDIYASTIILESSIKNRSIDEDERKRLTQIRASWKRDRDMLRKTIDEVLNKFRGYPALALRVPVK